MRSCCGGAQPRLGRHANASRPPVIRRRAIERQRATRSVILEEIRTRRSIETLQGGTRICTISSVERGEPSPSRCAPRLHPQRNQGVRHRRRHECPDIYLKNRQRRPLDKAPLVMEMTRTSIFRAATAISPHKNNQGEWGGAQDYLTQSDQRPLALVPAAPMAAASWGDRLDL